MWRNLWLGAPPTQPPKLVKVKYGPTSMTSDVQAAARGLLDLTKSGPGSSRAQSVRDVLSALEPIFASGDDSLRTIRANLALRWCILESSCRRDGAAFDPTSTAGGWWGLTEATVQRVFPQAPPTSDRHPTRDPVIRAISHASYLKTIVALPGVDEATAARSWAFAHRYGANADMTADRAIKCSYLTPDGLN